MNLSFLAGSKKKANRGNFQDFLPDADAIEQRPLDGWNRSTIYVLLAMLLAFVAWASISDVDEIVTARGKLVPTQANLLVQPIETSIIQTIEVKIGQTVKKGQLLATLDPTFTSADESQLRGRHTSLAAQASRLESELHGEGKKGIDTHPDGKLQAAIQEERTANYKARVRKFDEDIARTTAALNTNRRDQASLGDRVRSLREIESMHEKLVAQNFGAKQKLLEARERRQEVERDLDLSLNREAEIKRELAAMKADKEAFQKEWRTKSMEELATVRRERDSVGEQLQKAEKRKALVKLVAPVDGIVLDVGKRSIGSVVREAEPIFTLVALDAPLEAEVQIDAADIGYVKRGDLVHVKLEAFPFQKHGTLSGKVVMISEDTFTRDPSQRLPGQVSDAYYLARISLETTRLENVANTFRLLPGLTITGEIVVGQRSVISYFLYPMIRALDESIREPR